MPLVLQIHSKDLDRRAYWNPVELGFSRPGEPSHNALCEAFNSRFRQECLKQHWVLSLEEERTQLHAWRIEYDGERPHSALGYSTPWEHRSKASNAEATAA